MSVTKLDKRDAKSKGRKRDADAAELEIDVAAPEPPSKKALRKAKKAKVSPTNTATAGPDKSQAASATKENESPEAIARSDYGIWIGNLSFSTTKDDLIKLLTTDSTNVLLPTQITRVHLPPGPPKFGRPQNKGFAYVDVSDAKCLEKALKFSESMLTGRRVLIKNAKNFEGRPEKKNEKDAKPSHPPSRRIFVGNLDFSATVEALEAHFAVCGPVTDTQVATFQDTGKCKGYAWIEFEQVSSAEKAMRGWVEAEDDGERASSKREKGRGTVWVNMFQGRRLRMEYAEDKAVRYEKRFGKSAKKMALEQGESNDEPGISEVHSEEILVPVHDKKRVKKIKPVGKYSEETVQKLTGAIVESKGERVVFD